MNSNKTTITGLITAIAYAVQMAAGAAHPDIAFYAGLVTAAGMAATGFLAKDWNVHGGTIESGDRPAISLPAMSAFSKAPLILLCALPLFGLGCKDDPRIATARQDETQLRVEAEKRHGAIHAMDSQALRNAWTRQANEGDADDHARHRAARALQDSAHTDAAGNLPAAYLAQARAEDDTFIQNRATMLAQTLLQIDAKLTARQELVDMAAKSDATADQIQAKLATYQNAQISAQAVLTTVDPLVQQILAQFPTVKAKATVIPQP